MAKFTRSNISKLNERHFRLHDKEYTVYVEGDIDKSFWEKVFPVVEEWKPRIEVLKTADGEILGGWKNLVNYLFINNICIHINLFSFTMLTINFI